MYKEELKEMLNKVDYQQKVLIIKKEIYEANKKQIDDLMKDNYSVDLVITNTLDEKTNAIVMNKNIFYGIDYGE